MASESCAWWRDEAALFILGDLDGEQRAAVIAHLDSCSACRRDATSLAATVDAVSSVVPPATPSDGFVARVVDALIPEEGQPAPRPLIRRRSARWWVIRSAAAVVLLGLAGGAATVAASRSEPGRSPHPSDVVVTMRTQRGGDVGQAVISDEHPALVKVAFEVGATSGLSPDGRYNVVAVRRDGQTLQLGAVLVAAGRGGLEARTSIPATDIATVEVIGSNGHDLCSGRLPPPGPPPETPSGAPRPGPGTSANR